MKEQVQTILNTLDLFQNQYELENVVIATILWLKCGSKTGLSEADLKAIKELYYYNGDQTFSNRVNDILDSFGI